MAKKTHTWKIGERCRGGIITVEITGKVIVVIGKEWDHSAGDRRSSNQSNAQEFTRGTVTADEHNVRMKLRDFLNDLTDHYHSEKVLEWIESKVQLHQSNFF